MLRTSETRAVGLGVYDGELSGAVDAIVCAFGGSAACGVAGRFGVDYTFGCRVGLRYGAVGSINSWGKCEGEERHATLES